ncbi:MAG: diacylglycerol kinase [Gammaproteobacteria bacterium]|nr:diacylglycerol kinase [Gammaproteobacteria bacterium]
MSHTRHSLQRMLRACGNSLRGLVLGWRFETAFREEVLLGAVLLPLSFWVGRDALDYALLIGSVLMLMVTELFNSAIEALTDRVSTDYHELSGRAKDYAAAAVFLAFLVMVAVWGAIAWLRFAGA